VHEVSRRAAVGVFLSVAALTAGPPLAAFFEHGSLGIFRYFSADAFYYLAVADHSIGAPFFTFDGSHPTNGFHPLWQWLLAASFAALDLAPERQIVFTFGVSVTLAAVGTGLFALAILRRTQRPALALLGTVPGFFYPIVAGLNPHVGSSWSFANGMESSLSVFWLGILLTAWTGRRTLGPGAPALNLLISSALLTLVTLSRLDDIFLFAPFLLLVFATAGSRQEGIRRAGLASAIPFVVIGAYLVWNVLAAGSWLPSSGLTKAQPLWGLARNGYALVTFEGLDYAIRFKAARRPADYQMNIFAPATLRTEDAEGSEVLVNVFAGSERSLVEMRLARGRQSVKSAASDWIRLERVERPDPGYVALREREQALLGEEKVGLPHPAPSTHLWRGTLPATPARGSYWIEVRSQDLFGQVDWGRRPIRIE
jgi:hypothetical protein